MGGIMKVKAVLIAGLMLMVAVSPAAVAKDKKKHPNRGMLESMQSVPCGMKERGITGLGSIWASAGIQHTNADEKLCPQYLFRTDEMDYHIRPADMKHAVLLPVGSEGEFKIKKNRLYLKIPDGEKKMRAYQVIAMEPAKSQTDTQSTAYNPAHAPAEYRQAPDVDSNRQAARQRIATPQPPM
jgi:hypothetical protein